MLGLALMVTQSFLYNAVFFTYALVLARFTASRRNGSALPRSLRDRELLRAAPPRPALRHGRARAYDRFDLPRFGGAPRRDGLALRGRDLDGDDADGFSGAAVFFFASAGASSAYLTVSEIFPLEIRATAIALLLRAAQGAGPVAPNGCSGY